MRKQCSTHTNQEAMGFVTMAFSIQIQQYHAYRLQS